MICLLSTLYRSIEQNNWYDLCSLTSWILYLGIKVYCFGWLSESWVFVILAISLKLHTEIQFNLFCSALSWLLKAAKFYMQNIVILKRFYGQESEVAKISIYVMVSKRKRRSVLVCSVWKSSLGLYSYLHGLLLLVHVWLSVCIAQVDFPSSFKEQVESYFHCST